MKRIILLTLFLTIALCSSPVSTLNAGKIAEWQMNQSAEVMTRDYTSDFSVGVDGFATVRGTATGSLGVINGRTDPLKLVANTNNSSHYVNKVLTTIGEYYHLNTEIYVPSGQTTADGFAIFDGGVLVYDGASLNGSWAPVSVDYLATTTGLRFYLKDGTSFTFAGVGAGDDSLYVHGIMLNQVSTPDLVSSNHATMNYTAYDTSMYGGLNKCLLFDGTTAYVDIGNVGATLKSFSCWIKPGDVTTRSIADFDGGTHSIEIDGAGDITATGWTSPTIYVNGSAVDPAVTVDAWSHIVVTTATGFTVSDFDIGREATAYFDGLIDHAIPYNRTLSAADALRIYDKGPE